MAKGYKIFRLSTVAMSLDLLLKGQLKYLNRYYDITAISGQDQHLTNVRERENVRTIAVKFERKISLFQDIKSLVQLYFVLKKEKPVMVHSITPKAGLLTMIAARLAGVPYRLHTFTGLIFPSKRGLLQKILILMDKLLCACATHIYPEGLGVKKDLQQYKITNKPLKIIGNGNVNGVDLDYFNPNIIHIESKAAQYKNDHDFVFVFVGRLVKDKGIEELVESFIFLARKYYNIKLILVGEFEHELDPLSNHILENIKLNKQIIHVGFQQDIRPYLALSDVFVFPSYREGFPNVVLQAGAMGLPCIVTNISGSNEIIQDGFNGLIIDSKSVLQLTTAMERLILEPKLFNELKAEARSHIQKYYDQNYLWQCLKQEYDLILGHV